VTAQRAAAVTAFTVPDELSATEPPEARGLARDEVRLLVAPDDGALQHMRFRELPLALNRGDLVVVNTSDTEPAAVDGHRDDGRRVTLHVSGPAPDGLHVVELRTPDRERVTDGIAGETVLLPCGVAATLLTSHPDPRTVAGSRMWRARIPVAGGLRGWLAAVGRPIRYSYLHGEWPLDAYRTVFARAEPEFGSAEMPSAGRPFTPDVLTALRARGVGVAEIVLHTGVSSPDADELPQRERYRVPAATADAVNATREAGGRVVAVGTTVTRALETVADPAGRVAAGAGWTHLVLGPDRPARVVDGLITGWHQAEASHLLLLEAVAGTELVGRAYAAAVEQGYRWHEFGDSCLFLPAIATRPAV
jgi:S-adenosylmethionine:tRNA ribosyltransferase-isomerase